MIQSALATPEMVLGPVFAWGKLIFIAGSAVAAALLMRARFNDFVKALKSMGDDVAEIRTDLREGLDVIRGELGEHRTRIAVMEAIKEDRERRPSGSHLGG